MCKNIPPPPQMPHTEGRVMKQAIKCKYTNLHYLLLISYTALLQGRILCTHTFADYGLLE